MILRTVGLKHFSAAATKPGELRELEEARKNLLKERAATANRAIPKDPLADFRWKDKQRLAFLNKLSRAHRRRARSSLTPEVKQVNAPTKPELSTS